MSLYKAETRRLVKRRFTKLFVVGALLVLGAVGAGVFLSNHRVGPAEVAAAQDRAEQEYQTAMSQLETDKQRCATAKANAGAGQDVPECDYYTPQKTDFQAEWYLPPTFSFKENFPDMVTTLGAVLAGVAFVIGASFVGVEWSSGGMMNLLLWRPRRVQVLATKLAALLSGLTALTVLVAAVWTGFFALTAQLRGTTVGMTSGVWQSMLLMELRALVMVLVAGAIGFGLASIGRHTAMALGVAIGAIVVFQFGLGTVLSLAKVRFAELYLAPFWVIAWMNKSYRIEDFNSCDFSAQNGCQPDSFLLTWQMAGGALAIGFVAVVGAALWTMRSRDVT